MSTMEHKSVPCEIKAAGDDGSFELYALAFNNIDRVGDIIVPGAVSNVDELVKDGWGALNHAGMALPVAYADSAEQDAKGLLVRGKFHTHPDAQAVRSVVRERMDAGKSAPCSIGYIVDDASYEMQSGKQVRILKSIRVYEFSFVNMPANPAAGVVSAKSIESEEDQPLDSSEKSFLALLMKRMGMQTKAGKAISAANHDELSRHCSGMASTVADMKAHHKELKSMCKEGETKCMKMGEQLDEFKAFLDQHKPKAKDERDDDEDEEADEDEGEGREASRAPHAESRPPPDPPGDRREAGGAEVPLMTDPVTHHFPPGPATGPDH